MDRFRIISKLGAGGFGEAFRAWDTQQGIPVVLKRPLAAHLKRPDILKRFDREIARLRECDHPHIVPIIAQGHESNGLPYFAMRFLPAGSLADRRKPQPLPFLHRWLPAVAEALDYVHARGVLHRDVKPANIFFDTRTVAYLGDFGIAKVIDETLAEAPEHSLTSTGGEIGTYQYMGPEFFRQPRVLSNVYDQYALAVTVYEMVCGRRPFSGDSGQLIVAHATQAPPDIRGLRSDVPESLCNAVYRALAKRPDDRFPTCSSFAEALLRDVPLDQVVDSHQRFLCPSCHRLVRVPIDLSGRTCRCPDCNVLLRVSPNCDALWRREEDPTAKHTSGSEAPDRLQSSIRNSVGMTLRLIPAGTFMMGSHRGETAERPVHKVHISNAFYLGETAVTQDQWIRVMGDNPSTHKGPDRPVETISWNEAIAFCNKLSNHPEEKVAGRVYRLPTEAEWEHACRAGTTTAFSFGDDPGRLVEYAWFNGDDLADRRGKENEEGEKGDGDDSDVHALLEMLRRGTEAVGKKRPNPWGLYDMHGNVSEWCMDWFGEYRGDATDPSGPTEGREKVSRGGARISFAHRCSSAARQHQAPQGRMPLTGFRVVCTCPLPAERRDSWQRRPHPSGGGGEGSASDQQHNEVQTELESLASSPLARKERLGGSEPQAASVGKSRTRTTSGTNPMLRSSVAAPSPEERAEQETHRTARLRALLAEVVRTSVEVVANSNDEGYLYGWVGAAEISRALKQRDLMVSPEQIILQGPLKEVGLFTVKVRLAAEVEGDLKVWVLPNCDTQRLRDDDPIEAVASRIEAPDRLQSSIRNSVGMTLRLIPAGTFMMGSHQGETAERPVHKVHISNAFYLGETAVTQDQWIRVMGDNPSTHKGPDRPVETISWSDAIAFCNKLSNHPEEKVAGRVYRLPTEAEWEHACRAGTTTAFSFGDDPGRLVEYAWFDVDDLADRQNQEDDLDDEEDSDEHAFFEMLTSGTHAVAKKRPNPWGLYDMHGNVSEWCMDWFGEYRGDATDPSGPTEGREKVSRGGAQINSARRCSSAARQHQPPQGQMPFTGFRVACTSPLTCDRGKRVSRPLIPHRRQPGTAAQSHKQDRSGTRTAADSPKSSPEASDYLHAIPWYVAVVVTTLIVLAIVCVSVFPLKDPAAAVSISVLIICFGLSLLLSVYLTGRAVIKTIFRLLTRALRTHADPPCDR